MAVDVPQLCMQVSWCLLNSRMRNLVFWMPGPTMSRNLVKSGTLRPPMKLPTSVLSAVAVDECLANRSSYGGNTSYKQGKHL